MSRKSTLGDALAAHPSVDMLAPAIPIIIWAISGRPVPDDNVSQNLFVALSTLSGHGGSDIHLFHVLPIGITLHANRA